jgi:hypothetical protein
MCSVEELGLGFGQRVVDEGGLEERIEAVFTVTLKNFMSPIQLWLIIFYTTREFNTNLT